MEVAANELAGSVEAFQPLHLAGAAGGNPRGKAVPGLEIRGSSFDRNFCYTCKIKSALAGLLHDPLAVCVSNCHRSRE
jgi:hypothetical protein